MTTFNGKDVRKIELYIKSHWVKATRENTEDSGTLIGLPYPYVVPCMKGMFQELYYWDTYFTNRGLIAQGFYQLARNNVDDLLYLADRFGFVPNGSRVYYLQNSQIAYLSMMVRDIFELTRDQAWLAKAYQTLQTEYDFWMQQRITPSGLNRYYHNAGKEQLLKAFADMQQRLRRPGELSEDAQLARGAHIIAEYESGMDMNRRFEDRCADYNPVDLNSNLYIYEKNFQHFSGILRNGQQELWAGRAEHRKTLINQYCWNGEQKMFLDYDYVNRRTSPVESLASYYPLWAGLCSIEQARSMLDKLEHFECDFGLLACKPGNEPPVYQWDYPNGFAPLHYIVIKGLLNYGFRNAAERIARKYVGLVVKTFAETGDLWEKYNVAEGSVQVVNEYEMPAMLGWTAGVFLFCSNLLGGRV
jgi:alpha,alpha-trehalase